MKPKKAGETNTVLARWLECNAAIYIVVFGSIKQSWCCAYYTLTLRLPLRLRSITLAASILAYSSTLER